MRQKVAHDWAPFSHIARHHHHRTRVMDVALKSVDNGQFPNVLYVTTPSDDVREYAKYAFGELPSHMAYARALTTTSARALSGKALIIGQNWQCYKAPYFTTDDQIQLIDMDTVHKVVTNLPDFNRSCKELLLEGIATNSGVVVVFPRGCPNAAVEHSVLTGLFVVISVRRGNDTAKVVFSWAEEVISIDLDVILCHHGVDIATQIALLSSMEDTKEDIETKRGLHLATVLYASVRHRGDFLARTPLQFLNNIPPRSMSNEFFVLATVDFLGTKFLQAAQEVCTLHTPENQSSYTSSRWIETINARGVLIHVKRSDVTPPARGGAKMMSTLLFRVQTHADKALGCASLLRPIIDATIDPFGHKLFGAKGVFFTLMYVAGETLASTTRDKSMIHLALQKRMGGAMRLYHGLRNEDVRAAIDEAAVKVYENATEAMVAYGNGTMFDDVFSDQYTQEFFTKMMTELILQRGNVWRASGMLCVMSKTHTHRVENKLSCSFCNDVLEDTVEVLESVVACYNPACVAKSGQPRGMTCKACHAIFGHPICAGCSLSGNGEPFKELMHTYRESVAELENISRKSVISEQENKLLHFELMNADADIAYYQLLADGTPCDNNKKTRKKKGGAAKAHKLPECTNTVLADVSRDVEQLHASYARQMFCAEENHSLDEANLKAKHSQELNQQKELHARDMSRLEKLLDSTTSVSEVANCEVAKSNARIVELTHALAKAEDKAASELESAIQKKEQLCQQTYAIVELQERLEACERKALAECPVVQGDPMAEYVAKIRIENDRLYDRLYKSFEKRDTHEWHRMARNGAQIIQTIEHYFVWIDKDRFLQSICDSEGWVLIKELLRFDRLTLLKAQNYDIEQLLSLSCIVETRDDCIRKRTEPRVRVV